MAIALPSAGYFNGAITNANAKDAQDDTLAFLRQSIMGSAVETTLTIASGTVTPTSTQHAVETEGSTSSDDLTNIALTNMTDGQLITLRCLDATHVVTLKHQAGGSGQLNLWNGVDTKLDNISKYITLRRNGSNWDEVDRSYEDRVVKSKNSNYTVVAGDDASVIKVDASGGNVTITMTQAATLKGNFRVTIERTDSSSNTLSIARSGSDTFMGVDTSYKLVRANHSVTLASDGVSDYRIISRGDPGLDVWCGASAGTANAMTFTPNEPVRALYPGLKVRGTVTTANTSKTITLAVSGLTATAVKKRLNSGIVELGVGENAGYQEYVYDGTQWIMEVPRGDAQAADIASASTINLDAATGNWGHITGTTTINAITLAQGSRFRAIFDGVLQLTHGSSLILLSAANITTAAGDSAEFVGEASGVVRMVHFSRATGAPLSGLGQLQGTPHTSAGAFTFTTSANINTNTKFKITITGGGGGGTVASGTTGGGGGATGIVWVSGLSPNTGYSGVVGAGGAFSTNGGTSSITINGTTYSANGGTKGGVGTGDGAGSSTTANCALTIPGSSSAGAATSGGSTGHGGGTPWGMGIPGPFAQTPGNGGITYGAGGAPGSSAAGGTTGYSGIVLVEWIG